MGDNFAVPLFRPTPKILTIAALLIVAVRLKLFYGGVSGSVNGRDGC